MEGRSSRRSLPRFCRLTVTQAIKNGLGKHQQVVSPKKLPDYLMVTPPLPSNWPILIEVVHLCKRDLLYPRRDIRQVLYLVPLPADIHCQQAIPQAGLWHLDIRGSMGRLHNTNRDLPMLASQAGVIPFASRSQVLQSPHISDRQQRSQYFRRLRHNLDASASSLESQAFGFAEARIGGYFPSCLHFSILLVYKTTYTDLRSATAISIARLTYSANLANVDVT